MQRLALHVFGFESLLSVVSVTAAHAADIYVQWDGPLGSGVIWDPAFATQTACGSFIVADLGAESATAQSTFIRFGYARRLCPRWRAGRDSRSGFAGLRSPAKLGREPPWSLRSHSSLAHRSRLPLRFEARSTRKK